MTATLYSTATSTDLIRFVLARFDEDEAQLKRWIRKESGTPSTADIRSSEHLRADRTAKRQILGSVQHLLVLRDQPCEKPVRDAAVQILRCLAAPYAGHAQYRDEWRPSTRM